MHQQGVGNGADEGQLAMSDQSHNKYQPDSAFDATLGVTDGDREFARQILEDCIVFEEGIEDEEKLAQWVRNVRKAAVRKAASHPNIGVLSESDAAVNCARFVRWALQEGPWEGGGLDGSTVQEKAESLGLIVSVPYDPEKHGAYNNCGCDEGDPWFEFSPGLNAIRSSPLPSTEPNIREIVNELREVAAQQPAGEMALAMSSADRGTKPQKVCLYSDGCPMDGPVRHLCEHVQPSSVVTSTNRGGQ
jgi:hypothetical protein